MKGYKITSPAYKGNANHGTYCSLVVTDDAGRIIERYGDHFFRAWDAEGKPNRKWPVAGFDTEFDPASWEGREFSDEGRFVHVEPVNINLDILRKHIRVETEDDAAQDVWQAEYLAFVGGDPYTYLYPDGRKTPHPERAAAEQAWRNAHPYPRSRVRDYAFFTQSIIK